MKIKILALLCFMSSYVLANPNQSFVQKGCPKGRLLLREGQNLKLVLKNIPSKKQFWTSHDLLPQKKILNGKEHSTEFFLSHEILRAKPGFWPFSNFYFLMYKLPRSAELVNVCKLRVRFY